MRRAIVALALSSTTVVLDTTSLTWLIWYCVLYVDSDPSVFDELVFRDPNVIDAKLH